MEMKIENVLKTLKSNYSINIQNIELLRICGSNTYTVYGTDKKYFLKTLRHPHFETAISSAEVQMYLLQNDFPVIPIILTKDGLSYVRAEEQSIKYIFILYDFVDGSEPEHEDTERAGELIGKLHQVMKSYPGKLVVHEKDYYIDRYVEILRKKQHPKAELFKEYGNELWGKLKNLSHGYCHGELHRANNRKTKNGIIYVIDFDTSCFALPMYDIALYCNNTDWFKFDHKDYERSKIILDKFLTGYSRYNSITNEEIFAFYDFLAVLHFHIQTTVMEIYGYDCTDNSFFDNQYDLLLCLKEYYSK